MLQKKTKLLCVIRIDDLIYHLKQLLLKTVLILCILMDFPTHINTINVELLIVYFMESQVELTNYDFFLSLKVV